MSEHVIYRSVGDDGVIEITQLQQQRSLYLGSDAKQSSMDLQQPHRLILSYTRAMMSCLLFQPVPRHALLVGLGGASLARFILHHFPGCAVDAVELRAEVVKLAHGYFALPQGPSLKIFVAEAQDFLDRHQGRFGQYDLILVDAYNHDGMAESVKREIFFDACRARLAQRGVLSVNLWDHPVEAFRQTVDVIEHIFSDNTLALPVIDKGNLIVHAARDRSVLQLADRRATARTLETSLELEFNSLLRQLRRANRWRALGRLMGMA